MNVGHEPLEHPVYEDSYPFTSKQRKWGRQDWSQIIYIFIYKNIFLLAVSPS